ncbi:MAG: hypothetical protein IJW77_12135, partial [Clostridia bacterium]|nr:hypothetical protein [Clostridia bacterium]
PKKRASVRAELPPDESDLGTVVKAATDAHSSGGIIALSAQMLIFEHRRWLCASLHMAGFGGLGRHSEISLPW